MSYWKLPIIMMSEIVSSRADSTNGHIASYILRHMDELKNDSIRDVAAKANVSPSSISRFCRDIGLQDFGELKNLATSYQPPYQPQTNAIEPKVVLGEYVNAVTDSLRMVRESVDMRIIDRLCKDINIFPRVAAFGMMKSEGVAMGLQADLALMGKYLYTKLPFSEQLDYLECADEKDLIIIFSYKGVYYDYGFSRQSRKSKAHRPKVYFITSDPSSKERRDYDEVIWFNSRQNLSSHPYQLQLIAGLIAERYSQLFASCKPDTD